MSRDNFSPLRSNSPTKKSNTEYINVKDIISQENQNKNEIGGMSIEKTEKAFFI